MTPIEPVSLQSGTTWLPENPPGGRGLIPVAEHNPDEFEFSQD